MPIVVRQRSGRSLICSMYAVVSSLVIIQPLATLGDYDNVILLSSLSWRQHLHFQFSHFTDETSLEAELQLTGNLGFRCKHQCKRVRRGPCVMQFCCSLSDCTAFGLQLSLESSTLHISHRGSIMQHVSVSLHSFVLLFDDLSLCNW